MTILDERLVAFASAVGDELGARPVVVTPQQYGAVGNGVTDDSAAFVAAIAALKGAAITGYGYGTVGSARLFVPKGVYYLGTTTLDLTHGIIIEGESVGYTGPGSSVLKWAANTTGIRMQAYNTVGATSVNGSPASPPVAGYATLRNLTLYGPGSGAEGEYHGIHMRNAGALENVAVYDFQGDGIYILAAAGAGAPSEGNANFFYLQRVFAQNNRNGFFIDGADANSGALVACGAISNRRWGFWDSSFLGNSHFAAQTDSNGLVSGSTPCVVTNAGNRYCAVKDQGAGASTNAPSGTTADNTWWYYMGAGGASAGNNIAAWVSGTAYRDGGSYRSDGEGNASNLFSGCYHEGGQGFAQIDAPALVSGGSMRPNVRGVGALYGTPNEGKGIGVEGSLTISKVLSVNGTQVVTARQTGTAAVATDPATTMALVNDLRSKLITHGLIS